MTENQAGVFARLRMPESAPPWRGSTALLTLLGAFLAVLAVSVFVGVWFGDRPSSLLIGWTLAMLVTAGFVLQTRRPDRPALCLGSPRIALPLLIALNIALAMLSDLATIVATGALLPRPEMLVARAELGDPLTWLFAIVLMVLAQPVAEELVFRGVVLPSLRFNFGPLAGVIASALMYGLFHLLIYPPAYAGAAPAVGLWYAFVLPALDGLIFSVTRTVTGSTRAAIAAHAAFGLFAVLKLALLPV